jgi:hypothetical protein
MRTTKAPTRGAPSPFRWPRTLAIDSGGGGFIFAAETLKMAKHCVRASDDRHVLVKPIAGFAE